jgi:hypothetical protein
MASASKAKQEQGNTSALALLLTYWRWPSACKVRPPADSIFAARFPRPDLHADAGFSGTKDFPTERNDRPFA